MLPSLTGRAVAVVGWKDSGKTPVVERLVNLLTQRGFTVGTLKHVHADVALEPDAADSARHLRAGSCCAVVVGGEQTLVMAPVFGGLERAIAKYLAFCDYVIVEGFKQAEIPKIAVASEAGEVPPDLKGVVAVVHHGTAPGGYPAFTLEDAGGLADFLFEEKILKEPGRAVVLLVNGRPVPMNDFVQTSLTGVIKGFIASLKEVEEPHTIELTLKTG